MCGSYADTMICLKANSALILQIICLMNAIEESSCDNKDPLALGDNNNTDASCDNNNPDACDNPDEESSLLMSPNDETVRYLSRSRQRSKSPLSCVDARN